MRRSVYLGLVLVLVCFGTTLLAQSAPPNDNYDTATVVTTMPFTDHVNTTNAVTDDWVNPCFYGIIYNTVWYKFTPSADTKVEFNTFGSSFDTSITLYQDYGYGYLSTVSCNDDYGDTKQSRIQVSVTGGATYYIAVGSSAAAPSGGDLYLNVLAPNPPVNDDISNAVNVGSLPFTYAENVYGATQAPGDPTPACCPYGFGGASVWFVYDATYTGTLDFWADTWDAVIGAYTGSPNALTAVGCAAWGMRAPLKVTAGTRYYFAVESLYGEALGDLAVHFEVGPPELQLRLEKMTGSVSPSSGRVTVSGVLTCNRQTSVYLTGNLVQPQGQTVITGSFWVDNGMWKDCVPNTEMPWSGTIYYSVDQHHAGRSSALFRAGKALLSVHLGYVDPVYNLAHDTDMSSAVALKPGPAPK